MRKKTAVEMERERIAKITRAIIRLKYSLAADEEINNTLPDTLDEFEASVQAGELKQILPNLNEILNGTNN